MRIKETAVYQFGELSDSAKERARDWFRECIGGTTDWSEFVIDDAATVAKILGIDLQTQPTKLMNGTTRYDPVIYWSLDRGGGACFSGRYRHITGMRKALAAHIGSASKGDKTLHQIARELTVAQRACGFRGVVDITARDRSMTIECEDVSDPELPRETFEKLESALQGFAHWIYSQLQTEWDYQNSDEAVDEGIRANEYEFDIEGRRA